MVYRLGYPGLWLNGFGIYRWLKGLGVNLTNDDVAKYPDYYELEGKLYCLLDEANDVFTGKKTCILIADSKLYFCSHVDLNTRFTKVANPRFTRR